MKVCPDVQGLSRGLKLSSLTLVVDCMLCSVSKQLENASASKRERERERARESNGNRVQETSRAKRD